MHPIIRTILAILAGAFVGGFVNMAIIQIGPNIVGVPEGVDPNDFESIKANIHNYSFIQMMVPFLAHAIGTLVGAFLAVKIASAHFKVIGLVIGGFFLIGGIMAVNMIGGPMWFNALDLIVAYIPMGLLGVKLAGK